MRFLGAFYSGYQNNMMTNDRNVSVKAIYINVAGDSDLIGQLTPNTQMTGHGY